MQRVRLKVLGPHGDYVTGMISMRVGNYDEPGTLGEPMNRLTLRRRTIKPCTSIKDQSSTQLKARTPNLLRCAVHGKKFHIFFPTNVKSWRDRLRLSDHLDGTPPVLRDWGVLIVLSDLTA
jgi:hypothetical protein